MEVDIPPMAPDAATSAALVDVTLIVDINTWGGITVRDGIVPGRLSDPDSIFQRVDPHTLLIRTDGIWGSTLSMIVPLEANATHDRSGVTTHVTIDAPGYSSCGSKWFDKTVSGVCCCVGCCGFVLSAVSVAR
jgi:hypothetical protein